MLGKNAIKADRYGAAQRGVFFRKELPQLEHAIDRAKEIYLKLGWTWQDQKKTLTAPNGATLRFRPLERDTDAEKYQGQAFTDIYCEELTNWPDPAPIDKLRATMRSPEGVPCQFHATCNPGGPGHNWVKARYIDPCPQGMDVMDGEHGQFVFIPAKVEDNRLLLENDPAYVQRLKQSGSDALVKAWLEGDWNIVEGAYFDCWSSDIVLHPFAVPDHWMRFLSFDWGSAAPFSVGWWAVAGEDYIHEGVRIPRGAMIRYREWYGASGPNKGLKMRVEDVADGIVSRGMEGIRYAVADPAIFAEDGGPSIAERMGLNWARADNKRVPGWDQMRTRIKGQDDRPMIYCFSTCVDSIRTIPVLMHDARHPEDLDTNAEDHAADDWRYACMSRPWVVAEPEAKAPMDRWEKAFEEQEEDDYWA